MVMFALAILQFSIYVAIAVIGSIGHIATLTVLGIKNAIRRNTFDRTTHRLILHMSIASLLFCAVGMPLRAWNMAVGAKWPFTSMVVLTFEHYSVFVLMYVPLLLMTSLTLTRFTATFYARKHERWMKKLWIQLCLHLIPYVLPFGWFSIGGSSVLGIFKMANNPGTGLAFPLPINNTPSDRQLYRLFNVSHIVLNCFIPISLECVVYVAIFLKLYVSQRNREPITTPTRMGAVGNNTIQTPAQESGSRPPALETSVANAHAQLYGRNTIKLLQKRKVLKKQTNARLQQLRTVKVLAAVYCCELMLAFPNKFLFAVGLKEVIGAKWPALSIIVELLSFVMYACTPLVFARSSTEMRQAYTRLVKCVMGVCCCGRCVPKTKLALASNNVATHVNTNTNHTPQAPVVSVASVAGAGVGEATADEKSEEITPKFSRSSRPSKPSVKIVDEQDKVVTIKRLGIAENELLPNAISQVV